MTPLHNTLNSVIARLSEHEKNLPKANHVREKVYQSYLKKVISDLNTQNTEDIATLEKNIEQYLRQNWLFIRKNLLSYTALPRDVVTLSFCKLAESLSQHKNEHLKPGEAPVSELDLLMPELNWISAYEQDYPSYVVIHAPKVDTREKQEAEAREARLKAFPSPTPPPPTSDKVPKNPTIDQMVGYLFMEKNNAPLKRLLAIESGPSFKENLEKYNAELKLDEAIKNEISEYLELKKNPSISHWLANRNEPVFMRHLEPHRHLTKLREQLKRLHEQHAKRESAESCVKKGEYKELSNNYFVPTNIPRILETHITSTDGKSLIPVMVLADIDNNKRPYCHDFDTLQPSSIEEELARLTSHSSFSLALVSAKERWDALSGEDSHLLGQLQLLCKHFKLSDAYAGTGTEEKAATGAFLALVAFHDYYNALSSPIKETIPQDIRDEIDLLLKLASTDKKNPEEDFASCIATRRNVLAKKMGKHENILINIPSAAERKELIKLAEETLAEAREAFISEYQIAPPSRGQSHQKAMSLTNDDNLSADGDRLPLTKELFNTFKISIDTKTLAGLRMVMAWNADDIRETFKDDALVKKDFLNTINTLEELQSLCLEFSTQKLSALFSLLQPELLTPYFFTKDSAKNMGYILFGLTLEKQVFILTEFLNTEKKSISRKYELLLHLILDVPDLSQSIFTLINSPPEDIKKDMKDIKYTKDAFTNLVLVQRTLLLQNPELLKISLMLLDGNERFDAIMAKNNLMRTILDDAIQYPKSLKIILESLPDDEKRLLVISQKNHDGRTAMHAAIKHPESLKIILASLPNDQKRLIAISEKNQLGDTVMHVAINHPESLKVILASLSNDENRLLAIKEKNKYNRAVMHTAIYHPESLKIILESISNNKQRLLIASAIINETELDHTLMKILVGLFSEENLVILVTKFLKTEKITPTQKKDMLMLLFILLMHTNPGYSQLIPMVINNLPKEMQAPLSDKRLGTFFLKLELLKVILPSLSSDKKRLIAINEKNRNGDTAMHAAIDHPETLNMILASLSNDEKRLLAINERNQLGNAAMHMVVNHPESLKIILTSLPDDEKRLIAINQRDHLGNTAMHMAVNHPESLKLILTSLPDDEKRLIAINQRDRFGRTVMDAATQHPELLNMILASFPDYGLKGEQRTLSNLERMVQLSKIGGPLNRLVVANALRDEDASHEHILSFIEELKKLSYYTLTTEPYSTVIAHFETFLESDQNITLESIQKSYRDLQKKLHGKPPLSVAANAAMGALICMALCLPFIDGVITVIGSIAEIAFVAGNSVFVGTKKTDAYQDKKETINNQLAPLTSVLFEVEPSKKGGPLDRLERAKTRLNEGPVKDRLQSFIEELNKISHYTLKTQPYSTVIAHFESFLESDNVTLESIQKSYQELQKNLHGKPPLSAAVKAAMMAFMSIVLKATAILVTGLALSLICQTGFFVLVAPLLVPLTFVFSVPYAATLGFFSGRKNTAAYQEKKEAINNQLAPVTSVWLQGG